MPSVLSFDALSGLWGLTPMVTFLSKTAIHGTSVHLPSPMLPFTLYIVASTWFCNKPEITRLTSEPKGHLKSSLSRAARSSD